MRLAAHIYSRARGKPEDYRYGAMRQRWGDSAAVKAFSHIFMLQGLLLLAVAYPLVMANVYVREGLTMLDGLGVVVWLVGFLLEVVADYQLRGFIKYEKSHKGQIITTGLWRYSRHPNYFDEMLLWWGIFLIVLSGPHGWVAMFGPIVITWLLTKASGVPLLEKRYADSRTYQEYVAKTNKFLLWFPKK